MATSTLRFAIIVALVVGGVVLIDQAFPEADEATGLGGGGVTEEPEDSPSPSPDQNGDGQDGGQEEPGGEQPTAPTAGTMIVVFNASGESDLAGATQDELIRRFAYEAAGEADTASTQMPTTTIYFRAGRDRAEAEFVADAFFARRCDIENVRVQRVREDVDVPAEAQLAIYIGLDYAQVADPDDVC